MAFATGEVVPTPNGEMPFKVIFMQGGTVLNEWSVSSIEEGKAQIIMVLAGLGKLASNGDGS